MKTCGPECGAICDFCKHFDYNGEDLKLEDGRVIKGALYVNKGYCNWFKQRTEPEYDCEHFECQFIKETRYVETDS